MTDDLLRRLQEPCDVDSAYVQRKLAAEEIRRLMRYNDELQDKLREIRAIVKETLND